MRFDEKKKMSGTVRVLSERVMVPGREFLVKSVMERVVIRVRRQAGFVRGDVLKDTGAPHLYCVLTEWESIRHLNRWLEEPEYKQMLGEMNDLLGEPTRYQIFQRHKDEIFLL
jgi:quinol monooxygenase YgiN